MGQPREGSGFRAGLGVVGILTLAALALSPLIAPVEKAPRSQGKSFLSSHKYEEIIIKGSMTLMEIEETTGVPADYIIEALNLPKSVSTEEKLGSLKRKFGFDLNDIREIVSKHKNKK